MDSSSNNTLTSNTASSNRGGEGDCGIYLYESSDNTLINNTASSNLVGESEDGYGHGIYLDYSSNNTLANNTMSGNIYNFGVKGDSLSKYTQNIDTSNVVDGKPIYYWVDQKDKQIPSDAGFVGVINSTNITVSDLTLTNNSHGVLFAYTENSKIENVTASLNGYCGIHLFYSSNNNLTNNTASSNNYNGIRLLASSGNTLTNNTANSNNYYGILLESSSDNTLANNTANSNNYDGIFLYYSSSNAVTKNNCSNNDYGIKLFVSSDNTLANNTANSNNDYGIYLSSSSDNNLIYNNYFNNTNNAYDSRNNQWNITKTSGTNIVGGPYLGGNYWSDYAGVDNDGDGLGNTMLPYNSSGSIQNGGDYHPLVPAAPEPTYVPPNPENLQNTTGEYWVNYTWTAGTGVVTDGYNVSMNEEWYNTTETFLNSSVGAGNWSNITVWAWNKTGGGNMSATSVSDNVQAPAAPVDTTPPVPTGLQNTTGNYWVNYTWTAGTGVVTDGYNVSMNEEWYNTTETFLNSSVGAGNWSNITVWAWNKTGGGNMSATSVSDNVQAPAASTINCNCGNICVNTTGWWRDGGAFNANTTSIQAAVDNAGSGETICVKAGSYTENVDITTSHLRLTGEGAGVVTVTAANPNDHVFNVTADYVNISGFNATRATGSGMAGIYLNGADHCNISENNCSNNCEGIKLRKSSNNRLTSNTANSNSDYGISLSLSKGNLIYNNYFNNTNNAYDNRNNQWNITKTGGTNIIGGPHLGGNYWSDYDGSDENYDGLGDTKTPYNSSGGIQNGGDYHPLVSASAPEPTYIPPDPKNLKNTTGKYWVNYTWSAGTGGNATDSYKVNLNGTWDNVADTFVNTSVGPSGWANITVFAYNASGTGTLSEGNVSDNVQAPAAPEQDNYIPPDPTDIQNVTGNYWVNYTWLQGTGGNVTDSYNVNVNGTWYNGTTDTFMNTSVDPCGWANITVFAFNASGTGTLSEGNVSDEVQAPSDTTPPVIIITTPEPNGIYTEGMTLNFSATDDGSGIDTIVGNLTDSSGVSQDVDSGDAPDVGVYTLVVNATDNAGNTNESEPVFFVVYDPNGGSATGEGWFDPDGESIPKADFEFAVRYKKGVSTGKLDFTDKDADIKLKSTSIDWLVISSVSAQFQGTGTIKGEEGLYTFRVQADDNGKPGAGFDYFEIKIWDGTNTEADPIYEANNTIADGDIKVLTK